MVLTSYRRIKINEDGTRDIFATASFCKEGFEGARFANIGGIWIDTTICLETMLKEVPGNPQQGERD